MSFNAYTRSNTGQRSALAPLAEEERPTQTLGHLHDAKPRRPRRNRQSVTWDPTLDIYDDTFAFKQSTSFEPIPPCPLDFEHTSDVTLPVNRRSTLLAQPAQKMRVAPSNAINANDANMKRRRVSGLGVGALGQHNVPVESQSAFVRPERTMEIKREPRRRTIYIPSDDTTIATIHPGATFRPVVSGPRRPRRSDIFLDLAALPEETTTTLDRDDAVPDAGDRPKRNSRQSLLVAPRRAPLQQSRRVMQPTAMTHDLPGSGAGKENLPPGTDDVDEKGVKDLNFTLDLRDMTTTKPLRRPESVLDSPKRRLSFAMGPASPLHAQSPNCKARQPNPGPRQSTLKISDHREISAAPKRRASFIPHQPDRHGHRAARRDTIPFKLSVPCISESLQLKKEYYPVLSEDISKPELYEDNWLSHQETAMSECINSLFSQARHSNPTSSEPRSSLRKELTLLHHDPSVSLLYKRLQASLQFGALSISKDTLAQVGRYNEDLQQRQRFIDLWLKTYDMKSLQAAAEVVIGREAPRSVRLSGSPAQSSSSPRRKPLEMFLRTFLIRNEDVQRAQSSPRSSSVDGEIGSPVWAWRRTVVRSLMLILLLDKAQKAGHLAGCLFQPTSPFKSSASVIQALGNLLLPSIGNISRVLEHLSYNVLCIQYPLEEHIYHVNNLATDLRDGVLLTRLVEMLLYPPTSLEVQQQNVTVTLPCGDMLTSSFDCNDGKDCWVLSQHLKYPCASRVQKLYNVQIALSALRSVKDVGAMLAETRAEDIVDGHREKSVGLLWSLVSRWGLSMLLDFDLVECEVQRLRKAWRLQMQHGRGPTREDLASDEEDYAELPYLTGLGRYTFLLKSWARNATRMHGVEVKNLSTSFADGEAYRAMLQEYTACSVHTSSRASASSRTPTHSSSTSPNSKSSTSATPPTNTPAKIQTVGQHLHHLGCSRAFITLFTAHSIPSSTTTIPLLAFLASRLLPRARPHFAAVAIQRAWRRGQDRFELKRRVALKGLARECRVVVEQQRRIVDAAVTLQRWWRRLEAFWTRPRERPARSGAIVDVRGDAVS